MQIVKVDPQEARYFEQFGGDEPEPYPEIRYTVMSYFGSFAMFESADYAEALQVAQWDTVNMKDDPRARIQTHTVIVGGYANGGYFWLPGTQQAYRKRLDEQHASSATS